MDCKLLCKEQLVVRWYAFKVLFQIVNGTIETIFTMYKKMDRLISVMDGEFNYYSKFYNKVL